MNMEPKYPENMTFKDQDICDPNIVDSLPLRRRRSPVIIEFTDPRVTTVDIQKVMEAGMNVFKFHMSYSTKTDNLLLMEKIKRASQKCCEKNAVANWPIATCVTLKTCVMKTGLLENEGGNHNKLDVAILLTRSLLHLDFNSKILIILAQVQRANLDAIFENTLDFVHIREGSEVILTSDIKNANKCNAETIFFDNVKVHIELKAGMEISISQAEVVLICNGPLDYNSVKCTVVKGGMLKNMASVSVRELQRHHRPYLTKKDLQLLKFCIDFQIDMVIMYYVRHPNTVRQARKYLTQNNGLCPVMICGICTQTGLDNIDDIIKECDGIMIARDYLPYELAKNKEFRQSQIQKLIAGKCVQAGKSLYLSGGVFKVAVSEGTFIDREISDVSNAILDGVSGFILKDCENIEYTIEAVKALNNLCCYMEPLSFSKRDFWRIMTEIKVPINAAEAALTSCAVVANQMNARVIVLPTVTGRTVKALMMLRPSCLVLTVSTDPRIARLLYTCRCVVPLVYKGISHKKFYLTVESRIAYAVEYAVKNSWLVEGDPYVVLHRSDEFCSFCDTVRIWKVTTSKKPIVECPDDNEDTKGITVLYNKIDN